MPEPLTLTLVAAIAAEHADAVDREGRFPAEAMQALRDAGLLGSLIPVECSGLGLSLRDVARQCQALAQACSSTAMIYAMHAIQVACIANHALQQPWHRAFAARIAEEQLLLASITSEVGIGGDMRSSRCAVAVDGDHFTLEKAAPTVSYGAQADVFLVTTRRNENAPASDQVLVTCLRTDSTMDATGTWDATGMRGTCSSGFSFRTHGHADQIIPVPFADIAADTMVPVSHLLWAAVWTGIAADALTRARSFLRAQARRQPGVTPPGAVRLMHATGMLELLQARIATMLDSYDTRHDAGSTYPESFARATAFNLLKRDTSEMCHESVMEAVRICGMAGYKNGTEFSVGRHLRDILSAQLMISNDRIAATTGALLLAQRNSLATL